MKRRRRHRRAYIKGAVTVQGCYSARSGDGRRQQRPRTASLHWSESDYETTWFDKSMVYGEPISLAATALMWTGMDGRMIC